MTEVYTWCTTKSHNSFDRSLLWKVGGRSDRSFPRNTKKPTIRYRIEYKIILYIYIIIFSTFCPSAGRCFYGRPWLLFRYVILPPCFFFSTIQLTEFSSRAKTHNLHINRGYVFLFSPHRYSRWRSTFKCPIHRVFKRPFHSHHTWNNVIQMYVIQKKRINDKIDT